MGTLEMADSISRVSDILEQIGKLNEMVTFHKQSNEESMLRQYQEMRSSFIKELELILNQFNLKIEDIAA